MGSGGFVKADAATVRSGERLMNDVTLGLEFLFDLRFSFYNLWYQYMKKILTSVLDNIHLNLFKLI